MSTILEITEEQLQQISLMEIGKAAILFTSPFCGTCKVALKMLEIVQEAGVPYHLYQANINFMPHFRDLWKIKSIPSLVLIKNGNVEDTIYAMQSVSSIYEKLKV